MWWDWTQITFVDSVLFSLLSASILYFVGFGLLRLICSLSKKTDPFSSFDFLVKINFRIIFGFVFIFLIVLIFSIFNISFFVSTLLIIALAVIGFVATRHSFKLRLLKKIHFRSYAPVIAVFLILLITIFLSSMLIAGFYGSTNDDGADHTLMVRIILDNPNVLLTRTNQPYSNFILYYPSGVHVLGAFFVTLLNIPIQKIVILMSVILPSLIALSFYSTLKCLFDSKALSILGLIISAFFTIGTSWRPTGWAGLPLLLSIYLSISSMGLIYVFVLKKKMTSVNALLLGLIFFISSQTYPVSLLIISLWFFFILGVKLLPTLWNIRRLKISVPSLFSKNNLAIAIAFLTPILFSVPYFYFIYTHNIAYIQAHNITPVPIVVSTGIVKTVIGFNWFFDIPALSLFFSGFGKLLALASFSLILLIILFIPRVSQRIASVLPSKEFANSLLLIYLFMILIMSYLALTLFLPINLLLNLFDPERVWQYIFIPATILTAVVTFSVIYFSYLAFKHLFHSDKTIVARLSKNKLLACALLALLIFNVGLLSIPIISEQQEQYNQIGLLFKTYKTLNQDDVALMKWITENTPSKELILVSGGDSGQFLTSVTQRQTVSYYSRFKNYSDLMTLLTSNSSDLRAVPLMVEYNVSYVYIGSTATTYSLEIPYRRHFNATQFLATPYFIPTKQFGDAWLFQFNASDALARYEDYISM